jgi:hypothetical protein
MQKTGWAILGLCGLVLASLSPVPVQIWAWKDGQFQPGTFLSDVQPVPPALTGDLEGDGAQERLALASGILAVIKGDRVEWRSPADWQVDQAAITDLDRDRKPEVALLVWRKFAPWPIDRYIPVPGRIAAFHDAQNRSCHLILLGWRNGAMREIWAGSALAEPVRWFQAVAGDQAGNEILITLDSRYTSAPADPARTLSAWGWNGFGFSLLSRQTGSFFQPVILSSSPASPAPFYVFASRS